MSSIRNAALVTDALVARLAEVLDEHAECPAPVRPEPVMVELVAVDKSSRTLRALASGPSPRQRDGSES